MTKNPYKKIVIDTAFEFDVDPYLIHAVIQVESGWHIDALSPAGAAGLMQLMPNTFVAMAQRLRIDVPDICSPVQNIRCGTYYLRRQYDKFPTVRDKRERWKFALACYNCGPGYVQLAMRLAEIRHDKLCQTWEITKKFLRHEQCFINQRQPDGSVACKRPYADQVINYVGRVMVAWDKARFYGEYKNGPPLYKEGG